MAASGLFGGSFRIFNRPGHCPPILLQMHTRLPLQAKSAAQQQSNGNFEVRMSEKCKEWRD